MAVLVSCCSLSESHVSPPLTFKCFLLSPSLLSSSEWLDFFSPPVIMTMHPCWIILTCCFPPWDFFIGSKSLPTKRHHLQWMERANFISQVLDSSFLFFFFSQFYGLSSCASVSGGGQGWQTDFRKWHRIWKNPAQSALHTHLTENYQLCMWTQWS